MSVNLESLTLAIRKTPDGNYYALGPKEVGDTDFFRFTFAEWPAGSFEANLSQANSNLAEAEAQQTPTLAPQGDPVPAPTPTQ